MKLNFIAKAASFFFLMTKFAIWKWVSCALVISGRQESSWMCFWQIKRRIRIRISK